MGQRNQTRQYENRIRNLFHAKPIQFQTQHI